MVAIKDTQVSKLDPKRRLFTNANANLIFKGIIIGNHKGTQMPFVYTIDIKRDWDFGVDHNVYIYTPIYIQFGELGHLSLNVVLTPRTCFRMLTIT